MGQNDPKNNRITLKKRGGIKYGSWKSQTCDSPNDVEMNKNEKKVSNIINELCIDNYKNENFIYKNITMAMRWW